MAEFTSAEKVNIGYENEYSTDAMTGGPDKRRQLYYQLIRSMKKAESIWQPSVQLRPCSDITECWTESVPSATRALRNS